MDNKKESRDDIISDMFSEQQFMGQWHGGLLDTVITESLPKQVTFELSPKEKGGPRILHLDDAEFSVLFAVC